MYFEFAAVGAVVIFAILAFYIIQTLLKLQKTLKLVNLLTLDLNLKSRSLDSTVNSISNLGDICDVKTAKLKSDFVDKSDFAPEKEDYADDIADLLFAGIKIGSKYYTRRK